MGGVLGACGGLGIGWAANTFITRLAVQNHSDPVQIFYTPLNFIMYMVIGSIVVGFVTGLYPSYRAIKTNPLDALRYE
jgi:putative ABC transport system permease protein